MNDTNDRSDVSVRNRARGQSRAQSNMALEQKLVGKAMKAHVNHGGRSQKAIACPQSA